VPRIKHLHGALIALGDERKQCLIRAVLNGWPKRPLRGLAQRKSGLHNDPLFSTGPKRTFSKPLLHACYVGGAKWFRGEAKLFLA
jgi:hypothetical protein